MVVTQWAGEWMWAPHMLVCVCVDVYVCVCVSRCWTCSRAVRRRTP